MDYVAIQKYLLMQIAQNIFIEITAIPPAAHHIGFLIGLSDKRLNEEEVEGGNFYA